MSPALGLGGTAVRPWLWVPAAAGGVAACLAGNVAVLGPAWLSAAVVTSALRRPTDLRRALGVLGDAIAVGGFVLVALDSGTGDLAWAGAASAWPAEWGYAFVAAGITVRAACTGLREPWLLVVSCTVAMRLATAGAARPDDPVLAVLALGAAVVALTEGPLPAVPLVGVALWGLDSPMAFDLSAFSLAAGAVAAGAVAAGAVVAAGAGAAATGALARTASWGPPFARGAWGVPPGGRAGGVLALAALTPVAIGMWQLPLHDPAAVSLVSVSALVVLAAAVATVGSPGPEAVTPGLALAPAIVAAGALVLGATLVAPARVAEIIGTAGGDAARVIEATRGSLPGALGFAAAGTAVLTLAAWLPRRQGATAVPPAEGVEGDG